MDLIFNEKLAVHAKMMFKASVSSVGESGRISSWDCSRSPRATSLDLWKISWYCPSLFKCSFLSVSIHCGGTALCPSLSNSVPPGTSSTSTIRSSVTLWLRDRLTSHETPPTVGQGLMEFFDRKNDPKTETKLESCQKHGQSARRSAVMFAICNISIIRSFGRIVEKRKVF